MTQDKQSKDQEGANAHVEDDVKRKFREALDKKHSHTGKDVSDNTEHGKVAGARGAKTSGAQQMFRRKSGG
ncbi:DUF5302 domain-containing protein [Ornithinimicrobium cryptoxanthini]|uniref:DUF5302 domain-containing protein n=1 Tax=Ornithinimicrobium cryptoxanthini TaxID=2934161 RepID=A0ABY4YLL9_9MICO|nr:DUF5302 domain-containing protein [Ornithinimicrobium cryptoxanthini]USQ77522.1 DUF5302 domain-containing protein [Ornithinimicrobium cryptoxanthini]